MQLLCPYDLVLANTRFKLVNFEVKQGIHLIDVTFCTSNDKIYSKDKKL